jgi:rod shape-determining protein MreD
VKKNIIFILGTYFLVVFQTSFLARFSVFNLLPNLAIILVCILSLLEEQKEMSALIIAATVGFWLDVFSSKPIGFHIIILLLASVFIKTVIKKYVRIPTQERI